MENLGLYIHIPFCIQKCHYCDFLSFPNGEKYFEEYTDSLIMELEKAALSLGNQTVHTIFIGGGTPTILPSLLLGRILDTLFACFHVAQDAEITIEANPGTFDERKARDLKAMGINRLSMGLQAWQDTLLKRLGRVHTGDIFLESYHGARRAGFENINVDLMMALPEQTFEEWQETVEAVVALDVEHISAYSLIVEEGTPFFEYYQNGRYTPTDEELDRKMYHYCREYLEAKGYDAYEISNFAKPGKESRHNQIYWRTEEYRGFGLGAASFYQGERFRNTSDMKKYFSSKGEGALLWEDREVLKQNEQMGEFMFLGLRMMEGISKRRFFQRFGKQVEDVFRTELAGLVRDRLLIQREDCYALTDYGIDISNYVFEKFV